MTGVWFFFYFPIYFPLTPPPPHLPPPQICMSILHEMETVWHVLYVSLAKSVPSILVKLYFLHTFDY